MGINLSRTSAAARAQQRQDKMFTRGIWLAILILLVVSGVYMAFRIYNGTLKGDIDAAKNKIEMIEVEVSSIKMVEVANAVFRAQNIESNYAPNSVVISLLETISGAVVDAVIVDTYEYAMSAQGITVNVEMSTTDLLAIARQIESLKQTKLFHTVSVENINRDPETGDMHFNVVLAYNISDKK